MDDDDVESEELLEAIDLLDGDLARMHHLFEPQRPDARASPAATVWPCAEDLHFVRERPKEAGNLVLHLPRQPRELPGISQCVEEYRVALQLTHGKGWPGHRDDRLEQAH